MKRRQPDRSVDRHKAPVKPITTQGHLLSLCMMAVVLSLASNIIGAHAGEYRNHEAHEHGVARMNIALEGDILYIELSSPAANIVGFEHHPETQEQKDAIKTAMAKLKAGEMLFDLHPGAQGRLAYVTVDTDIDNGSGHKPESGHTHEQGEHRDNGANHDTEHHEPDEYDNRHSEFTAEYRFLCKKPEKLGHISTMLFRVFPGIEHIEVQILTDKTQTTTELTAQNNKILF